MSEMVERVAAAIYKSQEWDFAPNEDYSGLTDGCKSVFETAARAAILAMRTPNEAMESAFVLQGAMRMNFKLQWKAAVDAGLEEKSA